MKDDLNRRESLACCPEHPRHETVERRIDEADVDRAHLQIAGLSSDACGMVRLGECLSRFVEERAAGLSQFDMALCSEKKAALEL